MPQVDTLTTTVTGVTSIMSGQQNQTRMRNMSADLSSDIWKPQPCPGIAPFYQNCSKLLPNHSSSENTTVNSTHNSEGMKLTSPDTTLDLSTHMMVLVVFIIILCKIMI